MTKILFINTNLSWNKGSAAQVISTLEILKKFVPDASFTMISYCPDIDKIQSRDHNIYVIGYFGENRPNFTKFMLLYSYHIFLTLSRCILYKTLSINCLSNDKYFNAYNDADIIIDLSGDSFSDIRSNVWINILGILTGIVLKKPIVFFSQSIGPFRKWTLPLATFCLNKANLVIVREKITKNYLENTIKMALPIYLTADCAFILPYENVDIEKYIPNVTNKKPLVGVSVNAMVDDREGIYVKLMVQLIDYIIEKLDALVIIVPHVVSPVIDGAGDDRIVGDKIYRLSEHKDDIVLIRDDYSPEKLKGIIRLCDIFIGGRMHASIAALSSYVPTMVTGWSHKYLGIMQTLGQEEYVCDVKKMNIKELKFKADALWTNKDNIRNELKFRIEIQKGLALSSGKLVSDLLDSLKANTLKIDDDKYIKDVK